MNRPSGLTPKSESASAICSQICRVNASSSFSTHIVSDVEATATEIVVINKGCKLQHAAPEKLLQRWKIKSGSGPSPPKTCPRSNKNTSSAEPSAAVTGCRCAWSARQLPLPTRKIVSPNLEDVYLSVSRIGSKNEITARIIYHLARADFLERVRRYSFLVMLGLVVWLGYPAAMGNLVLSVPPDYRGEFNSPGSAR